MKQNLGSVDRILRAAAGLILLVLYFANVITGTVGIITLVLAAILLVTALVGFCPLYAPFKFSTRKS